MSARLSRYPDKRSSQATLASLFDRLRVRRWVVVTIGVAFLLAAIVGVIGPQRVLAAVRGWLGFVPGIGFVDHPETVRVLSDPVSITRDKPTWIAEGTSAAQPGTPGQGDQAPSEAVAGPSQVTRNGVTVTLQDAVADSSSTRIHLQVKGFNNARIDFDLEANPPIPPKSLAVAGTEIPLKQYNVEMAGSTISINLTYQPLPENVFDAVLTLSQIPGVPPGAGPEGWQIPLHFQPGQASGRIVDAIPLNLSSPEHQGITMVLDSLAQPPGMAALKVRLEMVDPELHMDVNWVKGFLLEDSMDRMCCSAPIRLSIPVDRTPLTFRFPSLNRAHSTRSS